MTRRLFLISKALKMKRSKTKGYHKQNLHKHEKKSPPDNPIPLPRQSTLRALNPISLPNLTHDPRRPTAYHTKTRHNHIGRHNSTIQHVRKIFQNSHIPNYNVVADVYMVPDLRGFDDGVFADEDVVAYFERIVRMHTAVQAAGRS